ncbi:cytochrome c [Daejeonella sp.]|jgi:mono/diheme cytochrome c family protein|uniref:cytochrome c n=1 Tax=Daejeonella sp. TaxID=2805397 RepID=UPI003784C8A9
MKNIIFFKTFLFLGICAFVLTASKNYSSASDDINAIEFNIDTTKKGLWLAPEWADTIKNTLALNAENISKGEELYNMYCFSCHGDTGYGDGPAGGSMGIRPANFHDQKVIKQKDGAIFWKLSNGNGNMPPYKEILSEKERWQLISFVRELGKQL